MGFSLRAIHGARAVAAEYILVPRGAIVALKIRIAAQESKQKIIAKTDLTSGSVETEVRVSRP
jgi:hypothetical protein